MNKASKAAKAKEATFNKKKHKEKQKKAKDKAEAKRLWENILSRWENKTAAQQACTGGFGPWSQRRLNALEEWVDTAILVEIWT